MEIDRCSITGCTSEANVRCECNQDSSVLLCNMHISTHTEEVRSSNHQLISLYGKLSEQDLVMLRETSRIIENKKIETISQLMNEYNRKLVELKEEYFRIISTVQEGLNPIVERIEFTIYKNRDLRYSEDEFIIDLHKTRSLPNIEQDNALDILLSKYVNPRTSKLILGGKLFSYSPLQGTKSLLEINNISMTKKNVEISSFPENFVQFPGICRLKGGDLFYCGGTTNGTHSGCVLSCHRIDPQTKESKRLPNMLGYTFKISPTQIDDCVYIFGGFNNANARIQNAWKYSIKKDKWKILHNMPFASENVSSIAAKNSILLSGYQSAGIYEYKNSTYKKIFDSSNGYGCLFKSITGELFYLMAGKIFNSPEENYETWREVGSYNPNQFNQYITSSPEIHGDYFIFTIHSNRYVRFNYKSLVVDNPQLA